MFGGNVASYKNHITVPVVIEPKINPIHIRTINVCIILPIAGNRSGKVAFITTNTKVKIGNKANKFFIT
jgi:hypothetical protein